MKSLIMLLALVGAGTASGGEKKPLTLELTLTDNLGFRIGGQWKAPGEPHVTTWFVRMPAAFFDGKKLTAVAEDAFYAQLYGPTWKNGNDDGSRYMPVSIKVRVLKDKEVAEAPWAKKGGKLTVYGPDGKMIEKL